jgi:hypothetical protein
MDGYALTDLIEQIGCLNEAILCKLSIQIIQCILEYEEKFSNFYKNLCTCEILFSKEGNLKVYYIFIIYKDNAAYFKEYIIYE